MSLYGLDILVEETSDQRHFWIGEINGINSGMKGFRAIYGDRRVEEHVKHLLQERYTNIQTLLPYCPYFRQQERAPTKKSRQTHNNSLRELRKLAREEKLHWLVKSLTHKINRKRRSTDLASTVAYQFPPYDGTGTHVINMVDVEVSAIPINPWVTEAITSNKLLQYLLLKDTPLETHLPFTALIGYIEIQAQQELQQLLQQPTKLFVIKPLDGAQGTGIQTLTRKRLERFAQKAPMIKGALEKDIQKEDYSFEYFTGIIQPFINTRTFVNTLGKRGYGSIRAIICNGQFIDAYIRISNERVANLARTAEACKLPETILEELKPFTENAIKIFEQETQPYTLQTYKQALYKKLLERRTQPIPFNLEEFLKQAIIAFRKSGKELETTLQNQLQSVVQQQQNPAPASPSTPSEDQH
ncbi:MAG: hypothetical protein Q7R96_06325 [Nanoarchaeota archaeon]|nr:hypothetical protein [Nanoarchaeota archaeon]